MGVAAAALLAIQPAAAAPSGPTKPQRILSMNLCADMLLLELVPKTRIAGVTYLAHDGAEALFPGADAGVTVNHGTPEDIINLKPDLILAGTFSTPLTRRLAKAIGVPQRRIGEIVAGKRGVTADTGLRLSKFFNMSDGFWTGLQMDFEAARAKDALAPELRKIKPWDARSPHRASA